MGVTEPQPHHAAIIGGGLVGASLALALQQAGLDVVLVEPHPPRPQETGDAWDTRIYAISPGNAVFLEQLGVWGRLDHQRMQRVESMSICGDAPTGRLHFSAYDAGLRELAYIVESGALQRALMAAIAGSDQVHLRCPAYAAALQIDADAAHITLNDGTRLAAQLAVGTDGGDSWVRRAAGIAAHVSEYRHTGVVANFETEKDHRGTAHQWFRADGVLALLPLPGRRVSMVWSATESHAQALLAMPADGLADTVAAASGDVVGGLRLLSPAAGFPLRLTQVDALVAARVALAGDAAHHVHPLAGQGVNLGFRDVRELAAVLSDRAPRQDCGEWSLLRRYARRRREDIAGMAWGTDTLQKLFATQSVWMSGLRNSGMRVLDRLPQLKNRLIRHAAA